MESGLVLPLYNLLLAIMSSVLSFYNSNFPEHCSKSDLSLLLRPFGRLSDISLPFNRNKSGKRFAFARFLDVPNPLALLKTLNDVWFGSFNLRVFFAKLPGLGILGPPPVGYQKSGVSPPPKEYNQSVSSRNSLSSVRSSSRPLQSFSSSPNSLSWLSNCLVGEVLDLDSLPSLRRWLKVNGFDLVGVDKIGGQSVLLDCKNSEEMKAVLAPLNPISSNWFSLLTPWNHGIAPKNRVVWLRCFGVPLSIWNEDSFKVLASRWGEVLEVCPQTVNKSRLEFGRIYVSSFINIIKGSCNIIVDGLNFNISWIEEVILPINKLQVVSSPTAVYSKSSGVENELNVRHNKLPLMFPGGVPKLGCFVDSTFSEMVIRGGDDSCIGNDSSGVVVALGCDNSVDGRVLDVDRLVEHVESIRFSSESVNQGGVFGVCVSSMSDGDSNGEMVDHGGAGAGCGGGGSLVTNGMMASEEIVFPDIGFEEPKLKACGLQYGALGPTPDAHINCEDINKRIVTLDPITYIPCAGKSSGTKVALSSPHNASVQDGLLSLVPSSVNDFDMKNLNYDSEFPLLSTDIISKLEESNIPTIDTLNSDVAVDNEEVVFGSKTIKAIDLQNINWSKFRVSSLPTREMAKILKELELESKIGGSLFYARYRKTVRKSLWGKLNG